MCAFGLVHFKCSIQIHRFPFKIRRWLTFSEIFLWKFYHLQYSWTTMQLTTTTWLQPHCSVYNHKNWCQTESSFVLLSKSLTHRFWHCSQKKSSLQKYKKKSCQKSMNKHPWQIAIAFEWHIFVYKLPSRNQCESKTSILECSKMIEGTPSNCTITENSVVYRRNVWSIK